MSPANVNLIWPSCKLINATEKKEYSFARDLLQIQNLARQILIAVQTFRNFSGSVGFVVNYFTNAENNHSKLLMPSVFLPNFL